MTLQRLAALRGEPEPGVRPPTDRAFADFYVPSVFEHDGLPAPGKPARPAPARARP
jgi:hypothetical protein